MSPLPIALIFLTFRKVDGAGVKNLRMGMGNSGSSFGQSENRGCLFVATAGIGVVDCKGRISFVSNTQSLAKCPERRMHLNGKQGILIILISNMYSPAHLTSI